MPDAETSESSIGDRGSAVRDPSEEAAASKLWAVYVSEAGKYDKALVESWKRDMEGILIFAGLFSASLTAFIIESYKTLMPDSGASMVQLLAHISEQLAAVANNGTVVSPPLAPSSHFTPPATSLVCNVLWFISLGLSLTCALIATLLEQWARNFLHKTDMRSSPVVRARIFSYLYYGLKQFKMHTIVEIIPLLLHISVIFFFAGLVPFLIPINVPVATLAALILIVVVGVYLLLTFLPMWHLDCPYRTPLSYACWRLSRLSRLCHWHLPPGLSDDPNLSLVQAMEMRATEDSDAGVARDNQALVWTVKSLADNAELEQFVEGVADALRGPDEKRYVYSDHIQRLLDNPDLHLLSRLGDLFRSCDSELVSHEDSRRRRITCLKALWAMGGVLSNPKYLTDPRQLWSVFGLTTVPDIMSASERWMLHYSLSIDALIHWSTFCQANHHLAQCKADVKGGRIPNLQHVSTYVSNPRIIVLLQKLQAKLLPSFAALNGNKSQIIQAAERFHAVIPHLILLDYLEVSSVLLDSPPYRWEDTTELITPGYPMPFSDLEDHVEYVLDTVVYSHLDDFISVNNIFWRDSIIHTLLSYWHPNEPRCIPSAVIFYLNARGNDAILRDLFLESDLVVLLWTCFPITLSQGTLGQVIPASPFTRQVSVSEILTLMWRVLSLRFGPSSSVYESVIQAVRQTESSPMTSSIIALMKTVVLDNLVPGVLPLIPELLPVETAIVVSSEIHRTRASYTSQAHLDIVYNQITEAKISLLAEFLGTCCSDCLPYKAANTLRMMGTTPRGAIHHSHQFQLAKSMRSAWELPGPYRADLFGALIHCEIFDIYARTPDSVANKRNRHPWLEASTTRGSVKDTLTSFATSLSPGPVMTRVKAIIYGFELLHGS
ncbi:hypothetical protein GGX14DRAFT_173933 [Mycena pura]|uniref:DUF6535 domain-containing protein n=1 Tax=Mycena pura TaxID=153505 RepID=A0AAD6V7B2_9AGAR|nr:hypothetical protein GGX14DRAFT_173933 [Mycena pura]